MPAIKLNPQRIADYAGVLTRARRGGMLSEEAFERLHAAFIARDADGVPWTIGLESGAWNTVRDGSWAPGEPPADLYLESEVVFELERYRHETQPDAPAVPHPPGGVMNAELQIVIARLETLERQARAWKLLGTAAIVLAVAAIAVPFVMPMTKTAPGTSGTAKFAVVEAQRFLLRDASGALAGGMEIGGDGGLKLVLGRGYGSMGAAFLEVQADGNVHFTLRGPDGRLRAALQATKTPFMVLAAEGMTNGVSLTTAEDGAGSLLLTDHLGRARFRAP